MFEQFIADALYLRRNIWDGWGRVCDHPAYLILDDSRGDIAGFPAGGGRTVSSQSLRWLGPRYSSVFRNTPLLVQLFSGISPPEKLPQALKIWLNTPHEN